MEITTDHTVHSNALGSIQEKINSTIDSLSKELEAISNIKGQMYANVVFYMVIVGIMIFFISIILFDLYHVFKNYQTMNKDSNRQSFRNNSSTYFNIDNYSYEDDNVYNYNVNYNEYIINKLNKQNKNVKDHFEELLKFKQKHNIDDKIHTSVTPSNISPENDNYNYNKKKHTPFWNMLFSPPKHYELMNKIGNHPGFN